MKKGSCDIGIVGKFGKPNCLFAPTDKLSRLADDDQGSVFLNMFWGTGVTLETSRFL